MNKNQGLLCLAIALLLSLASTAGAAGISVDAGLTPAEGRWIFREQFRLMGRSDDPTAMNRSMDRLLLNTVLGFGIKRNIALLVKVPVIRQEMSMLGVDSHLSGIGDLTLIAKASVYRQNTRQQTLGIAATMGVKFPTGDESFGSETLDLKPGLFVSWRRGIWASDLNLSYAIRGVAGDGVSGLISGDVLALDWAVARQFSLGTSANLSFSPVVEFSWKKIAASQLDDQDVGDSGESLIFLSPGFKLTRSSFIFELLTQLPVWQDQNGLLLKSDATLICGVRVMF